MLLNFYSAETKDSFKEDRDFIFCKRTTVNLMTGLTVCKDIMKQASVIGYLDAVPINICIVCSGHYVDEGFDPV